MSAVSARRIHLPTLPPKAWAALATVYVFWGSTYLAIRVAVETLPPLLMAAARFLVAGGVLYAIAIRRGDREGDRPTLRQWGAATIVGGALLLGGNGGVVWAEQRISSGIAALLVATVPLWMALFAWLAFRERLPPVAVAGIAVGFLGTALLVGGSGDGGGTDTVGGLVVVGAAMSWAAGSLYARRADLPRRPLVGAAMQMLGGAALLALVGAAAGEFGRIDAGAVSLRSALGLGWLIVFGSLVAFSAYTWLLQNVQTSIVSTYAYVNPVVAVLLGWAMLDEVITARTLLASGIIVVAVAMIVTARTPAQAELEEVPSPADAPPFPQPAEAGD